MAIYGIGAYYGEDVSSEFIQQGIVGVGWSKQDAPELHEFIAKLKPGDVVYVKSFAPSSADIIVKAVGLIKDETILNRKATRGLVSAGRKVVWLDTEVFRISKPRHEKNNVRRNTLYEEHHPLVRREILGRFISRLRPPGE